MTRNHVTRKICLCSIKGLKGKVKNLHSKQEFGNSNEMIFSNRFSIVIKINKIQSWVLSPSRMASQHASIASYDLSEGTLFAKDG